MQDLSLTVKAQCVPSPRDAVPFGGVPRPSPTPALLRRRLRITHRAEGHQRSQPHCRDCTEPSQVGHRRVWWCGALVCWCVVCQVWCGVGGRTSGTGRCRSTAATLARSQDVSLSYQSKTDGWSPENNILSSLLTANPSCSAARARAFSPRAVAGARLAAGAPARPSPLADAALHSRESAALRAPRARRRRARRRRARRCVCRRARCCMCQRARRAAVRRARPQEHKQRKAADVLAEVPCIVSGIVTSLSASTSTCFLTLMTLLPSSHIRATRRVPVLLQFEVVYCSAAAPCACAARLSVLS